jgi:hypothetical protein
MLSFSQQQFILSPNRRLSIRRVPSSLQLASIDSASAMIEDCCVAISHAESESVRLRIQASDQVFTEAAKGLIRLMGIKPKLIEQNSGIRGLIESAVDQSCTLVGSGTDGIANEETFSEMSAALIASGLFVRIHEEINMEMAQLACFISASNLLIRSTDGKARIIDVQSIKQSITAKIRTLQNSNPTIKEIRSRAEATEQAQIANFGIFTSNQVSERSERLIMTGSYLDQSVSIDFRAIEDVIAHFLNFIASSGAGVERLAGLVILARTPAISALIANKFKIATYKNWKGSILSPDTILGWAPDATILSAVFSELNLGIISLKNFPTVEFIQVANA